MTRKEYPRARGRPVKGSAEAEPGVRATRRVCAERQDGDASRAMHEWHATDSAGQCVLI